MPLHKNPIHTPVRGTPGDCSWDEDVHTLRRPGLGEVFTTLVNTGLNALRLEGWFPHRMSMPLRAKTCAFRPKQTIDCLYGRVP